MSKKPIRVMSYRVDLWLNKATNETLYGVSVKIEGVHGWVRVAEDNKAVILNTRTAVDVYITKMKAERDERGFKRDLA